MSKFLKRAADWAVTPIFLICFGAVLIIFDPIQRIAMRFGRNAQQVAAGWLQVWLVRSLYISGARIEVERSPLVREKTSYLIIANHQSMFDIPFAGSLLFSNFPKYVSKMSLSKWLPSISYNLRNGGNALIERSDREQATQAIAELGRQAKERGVSVLLYPEGTRARQGELRRFRSGGALALLEAAPDLPVVPFTVDNSWKLFRHNLLPVPFGTRVRIWIGDPIERRPDEDRRELVNEVHDRIEKTLLRWRGSDGEGDADGPE
ncbi:MAG: lysophospholipid acyltransferase family protein [Myxococcota bacterium]